MHNVTQSWNENHSTPLKWKICIDTSALLERSWAMFAGLGWIGKNTMLIHPKSGSFFLLAAVLINEPLDLSPKPLPNYCGNCNRCITSCPTQAFVDKNILDARKCISYLTLEKKSSNGDCKNNSGTWVAGCDICQEVCPFNKKAIASSAIQNDDPVLIQDWEKLINETESEYNYRVKYSALNHVKYSHFKKNIRLANKFTESTTNYL
ncbi:MAG: epoxyqueuosine reductase [Deltaproteobacteria bacterium]|nr:epoxyqueuosine reductase [Deltaproteobacteria bacterium]